ncbi:hypothetical protein [Gilvimarinus sp. DA14]|uniref:hypothetical protein n=1 Tax=Gilvimarinus sp. DA14 TaxID=2956798 RepID=UPI0020B7F5E4|nr:hypothetical protein [Gilvimarinus sp. DA14]UTF58984.1 hypothetical protein NHM04_10895 [Gilvimarinus sp. DA14]
MQQDKLDQWLEEALLQDQYLHDDGFTDQVMARLPQPAINPRRVKLFNWGAGLAAAAVAGSVFPWSTTLPLLSSMSFDSLLSAAVILAGLFTAAAISAGAYAFNRV